MVVDVEFILAVKVGPVGVPIAKVAPVADPVPPNKLLIVALGGVYPDVPDVDPPVDPPVVVPPLVILVTVATLAAWPVDPAPPVPAGRVTLPLVFGFILMTLPIVKPITPGAPPKDCPPILPNVIFGDPA